MSVKMSFTVASCLVVLTLLLGACVQPTAQPSTTSQPISASKIAETPASKPAATAAPPSSTTKPATDQARYGGVLTRPMNRDVPNFDIQQGQGADVSQTLTNIYEGLVRLDPIEHTKVVPELAESWKVSADGKVYTFEFGKGIKWHDGKAFTMEDVKYSLDRMHEPKAFNTISPRGQGLLEAMDSAEIVGENTVKITTKYPSASFLPGIATGWVAIEPKHILVEKGDMKKDAVGTGPFRLKQFNPDVSLELVKNQDYHVKGVPYLDGVTIFTIKDAATRFSAFRAGKVRMSFVGSAGLTPTEGEIVRKEMADVATVQEYRAQARYTLAFNLKDKPWNDVRVRKAVDLAFDRQAAIKVHGKAYMGSIFVTPWGMDLSELAKLPGYRQPKDADIAEAKKLLAEAGYPDGFKTVLLSQAGGAREAQAVVAKDQLAKIGIDARLDLVEYATVLDRAVKRSFDVFLINWVDNTGDPDETLYTYYATGGSRNYGDFSDKDIDALIQKQAQTIDEGARKAILAEIEKKLMDQVPMVIVLWEFWEIGTWKEVKNFSQGNGIHPWGKYDRIWLAK